jgi:hypothetical protein
VMLAIPGGDVSVSDSDPDSDVGSIDGPTESPINALYQRPAGTSYVLVKIGTNRIPLFVGVGASCCVVSSSFLSAMGYSFDPSSD